MPADIFTLVTTVAPSVTIPPYGLTSINSNGQAIPTVSTDSVILSSTVGVCQSDCISASGKTVKIQLVGRTKVYIGGVPLQKGRVAWANSVLGSVTTLPSLGELKVGVAVGPDEVILGITDYSLIA